jgi:hypothetical protein
LVDKLPEAEIHLKHFSKELSLKVELRESQEQFLYPQISGKVLMIGIDMI